LKGDEIDRVIARVLWYYIYHISRNPGSSLQPEYRIDPRRDRLAIRIQRQLYVRMRTRLWKIESF